MYGGQRGTLAAGEGAAHHSNTEWQVDLHRVMLIEMPEFLKAIEPKVKNYINMCPVYVIH